MADFDTTPGIQTLCPTRLTVKYAAPNSINSNHAALLDIFEDSFGEEKVSAMKARINGVRYQMMQFEFYFGINLPNLESADYRSRSDVRK